MYLDVKHTIYNSGFYIYQVLWNINQQIIALLYPWYDKSISIITKGIEVFSSPEHKMLLSEVMVSISIWCPTRVMRRPPILSLNDSSS